MRSRLSLVLIVLALAAAGWWQSRAHEVEDRSHAPAVEAAGVTRGAPADARAGGTADAAAARDLTTDERRGGHTLTRHVGRTDDELAERLRREPGISAASTYTDRATAERTVTRVLTRERSRIDAWLARSGNRPNLALNYRGTRDVIGRSLERGARGPVSCLDAVVVLRWDGRDGYYVLTSYPEAR